LNIDDSVKAAGADLENLVKMPGVIEEMERLDKEKAIAEIERNKIVIEEDSEDDEEDVPVKITKKEPVKAAAPTGSVEQQCKEDMEKK
jgi:enamine deaminase RidA (YjgF/YER057c/UK114 family)